MKKDPEQKNKILVQLEILKGLTVQNLKAREREIQLN